MHTRSDPASDTHDSKRGVDGDRARYSSTIGDVEAGYPVRLTMRVREGVIGITPDRSGPKEVATCAELRIRLDRGEPYLRLDLLLVPDRRPIDVGYPDLFSPGRQEDTRGILQEVDCFLEVDALDPVLGLPHPTLEEDTPGVLLIDHRHQ